MEVPLILFVKRRVYKLTKVKIQDSNVNDLIEFVQQLINHDFEMIEYR